MSSNNDELVSKLRRVLSYSRTVGPEEHEVLRSAIAAIRTPDHDLADMAAPIATADALLTMLSSPAKFKEQLATLNTLVKAAKEERAAVAAERAALAHEHAELEPKIKSVQEAHARRMVAAEEDFNQKCSQFQKTVAAREAAVSALEKLAAADRAAAATAREDAERRLAAIRSAAA